MNSYSFHLHLELLRKSAEHTLMDMVQLLFTRLPQFKEDPKWTANMKKVQFDYMFNYGMISSCHTCHLLVNVK
jgi:hypothetical protein